MITLRRTLVILFLLGMEGIHAEDVPTPVPEKPASLSAITPPLDLGEKHDFPASEALNDEAAEQLKGLCSLKEFQSLPEAERHVYSFENWPGAEEKLGVKSYTFSLHFGGKRVTSQKIAIYPTGGGPNSHANLTRTTDAGTGKNILQGLGNLDWGGKMQHTFTFDKPVTAFGVVLRSSDDMALRKFYWPAAKELNGFPISYTLADGTLVHLGERDVMGARMKGGTDSFLGVIDRSGRGIVSVNYTLAGLGGNKAQSLGISHLAFATMSRPEEAQLINMKGRCDFEMPDSISQAPEPRLEGLCTLEDFRFIVPNKRSVYRFDTWPKSMKDSGPEFVFDLKGDGTTGQKVTIQARNSARDAKLVQARLMNAEYLPEPVLGGLGSIDQGSWAEQTFVFDKPVRAFGVTYRSPKPAKLAEGRTDGNGHPVSYTLSDGTEVTPGKPGSPAGILSTEGKTFVGVIDKSGKGIVSATIRVEGGSKEKSPLYIGDLAFAMDGPPPGKWKLVLDENFDGDKLNPDVWAPGYTFKDVINSEMQGYVPENITVADGICTIKVEKRDCFNTDREGHKGPAQKFASGAFTSYGKFTPTYGYFEARIKMPHARGAGIWPAFWMLPDRGKDYPLNIRSTYRTKEFGTGIEIDIFEFMPRWKKADGTFPVHMGCIWSYGKVTESDPAPHGYGGYALDNDGWGPQELTFPNLDTEFHTYGLYWSPERLIYYIDGKPVFRVRDPKHVPDVPHYFLFNIAISGNGWGKSPDKSHPKMEEIVADMPNSMEIDYFRAYSGTLDEAVPPSPGDNPAVIRKYSPPPKADPAAAGTPAPSPAPTTAPIPPESVPDAPVNSTIVSPSNG